MRKGNGKNVIAKFGIAVVAFLIIAILAATAQRLLNSKGDVNEISSMNLNEPIPTSVGSESNPATAAVSINREYGNGDPDYGYAAGEIVLGGNDDVGSWYSSGLAYHDGRYANGYCLNHGGTLEGTFSNGTTLKATGKSAYNINNSKNTSANNSLKWLFDNIYRMNMTASETRKTSDSRAIEADNYRIVDARELNLYKNNLKNILTKNGKNASLADSSKVDIFVAQQFAIWYFTSNATTMTVYGDSYAGLNDEQKLNKYVEQHTNSTQYAIYEALVAEAKKNGNYSGVGTNEVTLSKGNNCAMVQSGNDVIIGPYVVNNSVSKPYRFSFSNLKLNGNTSAKVYQADKTTELTNNMITNYKGNVYIKFSNYKMSEANVKYNFTGTLSVLSYKTEAVFWSKKGKGTGEGLQEVTTIHRTPNQKNLSLSESYERKVTEGSYKITVQKENWQNTALSGATFAVRKGTFANGAISGISTIGSQGESKYIADSNTITGTDKTEVLEIKETAAPSGYARFDKRVFVVLTFKISDGKYIISNVNVFTGDSNSNLENITNISNVEASLTNTNPTYNFKDENGNVYAITRRGDTQIDVYIKNPKIDLALKKMITQIKKNNTEEFVDVTENTFNVGRHSGWNVDTSTLADTTNATYTMNKTPVEVEVGDEVTYAIKIFNEGEVAAKADKITDYIPAGLEVTKVVYNNEDILANPSNSTLARMDNSEGYNNVLCIELHSSNDFIPAYNSETGEINNAVIYVTCKVKEGATGVLTNVAEITEYETKKGIVATDIDSTAKTTEGSTTKWGNWTAPNGEDKNTSTKDSDAWRKYSNNKDNNLDGQWHPDFLAQDEGLNGNKGDDDDFDKLVVKGKYSLTIKKVNESSNNEVVNDVKFNISRNNQITSQTQDFTNVETVDGTIGYEESLSTLDNGTISYTFTEVENTNYVQLWAPIKLNLNITNGKIKSYDLNYGNSSRARGETSAERTFAITVDNISLSIKVTVDYANSKVNVEIGNKLATSSEYKIRFRKISSGNGAPLSGVTFTGTKALDEGEEVAIGLNPTDVNGYTNVLTNTIDANTYRLNDNYKITEVDLGSNNGYTKLNKEINITAAKTITNEEYGIQSFGILCDGKIMRVNSNTPTNSITVEQDGLEFEIVATMEEIDGVKGLTITVPNAPDKTLTLILNKFNKNDDTQIRTRWFANIKNEVTGKTVSQKMYSNGELAYTDNVEASATSVSYIVKETRAPAGFINAYSGKYIKLQVELTNGEPTNATATVYNNSDNTVDAELTADTSASIMQIGANQTIVLSLKDPEVERIIDLALKKVITEVDGVEVKSSNGFDAKYDRLTTGDDKVRINTAPLQNGETDAEYFLNKTPILVQKGSKIKYQIRIYNEGTDLDSTASEIKDYLPTGLELVDVYYKDGTKLTRDTDYTYSNKTITITALADKDLIAKYNGGDTLSYDYVVVECQVTDTAKGIQTNIAEISEYKTSEGVVTNKQDRDSEAGNWNAPSSNRDNQKWIDYAGNTSNTIDEGAFKNYIGQEDDDDFEKVLVGEVDLVLKKVITNIGETSVNDLDTAYQRFQGGEINVFTDDMNRNDNVTTAQYLMNKTPIKVKIGDEVTYQIRIYNEGSIDATAAEITDYIPKGLTLKSVSYNGNTLTEGTDYTANEENVLKIKALKGHLIEKYNGTTPDYDYVTVVCTVNGDRRGLLTNVAEISKYETSIGEITVDRDSETTGTGEWQAPTGSDKTTLDGKSSKEWADYYKITTKGEFLDYPGQQDDDDFEKIIVETNYKLDFYKFHDDAGFKSVSNAVININGEDYTTDTLGDIDFGTKEFTSTSQRIDFNINEVDIDGYVKIDKPIYITFVAAEGENGGTVISAYDICTTGNNLYSRYRVNKDDYTAIFYIKDVKGNRVRLIISIETKDGVSNVSIGLENKTADRPYEINLYKVDETTKEPIEGSKFEITPVGNRIEKYEGGYLSDETVETNENGTAKVGTFVYNRALRDRFEINEIETLSKYLKLGEPIYLEITDVYKTDENNRFVDYELNSFKLLKEDGESEDGTNVTLKNVKIMNSNQTVDVTAELTERTDAETGKTIPVITITVPNVEKIFDLSLRKFIVNVNNNEPEESREPAVNAERLINGESTTAKYDHTKDPLLVDKTDTVKYDIRIYNEGERAGYASAVMDDIPEGLEMVKPGDGSNDTSKLNAEYRWLMYRKVKNGEAVSADDTITYGNHSYVVTENPAEAELIVTDYLSMENGELLKAGNEGVNPNLIPAFDADTMTIPEYRDVFVEFKVKETAKPGEIIENKAQITDDRDEDNNEVEDRDSTTNVWVDGEDDQDIERLIVTEDKQFDLSLRKFIAKVNDNPLEESREPSVDVSKLISGESTTATYTHPKEESPVLVNPEDIVEYTIRVYNEGEVDGYADMVLDDIPEGVEMIAPDYTPDGIASNLNAEYRWVMCRLVKEGEDVSGKDTFTYDKKQYVITDNASEAEAIVTDYLSKKVGDAAATEDSAINPNLLRAFNPEIGNMTEANYRDIKVQFRVQKEGAKERAGKLLINHAQIIDDSDSDGNSVTDRDSTTNVWIDGEDDQDYDVVKLGYFDLALYKWVTDAIVTEDGKTTEYPSYHSQTDKSNMVDISIKKNKVNDVTVKFKYQIKVENQGTIAGKALEVKDHIPAGLKFVAEDNTEFGWVATDDQTVTTDYLKDTVLEPGETAEVTIVLTWINGSDNLGEKVNYAEISEDENEHGWKDIDSSTDNFKDVPREDDEDGDVVMLQIRTGAASYVVYIAVALAAMSIVVAGVVGIKKYVLK